MSWTRYALRRLIQMVPLLLGIVTISFVITHALPGDVAAANLGQRAVEDPGIVSAFRREWGLDRPLPVQYLIYLHNLLSGNLGRSIATRRPVATDLGTFLPATVELATLALVVSLLAGIPLGVLSAVRRGQLADNIARLVSLIGVSAPVFWLGLAGLFILYFRLRLLPGPGRLSIGAAAPPRFSGLYLVDSLIAGQFGTFLDALGHLVLPALVLGSYSTGLLTRVTRSSLLEVLSQDYIRTARAKGVQERIVIYRHGLKNALLPTVTVVGLAYGNLLSGAVLTETVFSWPGIGRYAYQAATRLDFPAVLGTALLIALAFSVVNLVVDISYLLLDPKLRFD